MLYKEQAFEKLDKEYNTGELSRKGKAVGGAVIKTLKMFCGQEDEFAQAIAQTDKTVAECIGYTVKECGNSVSDIEVYKRAAEFYFPGAKVHMTLTLDLTGDAAAPDNAVTKENTPKKRSLEFSFDELFGGGAT